MGRHAVAKISVRNPTNYSFACRAPSLGKSRPDVGPEVLNFPHVSHVIYYVMHEQQLVVFGALHKRMVPLNHLTKREVI